MKIIENDGSFEYIPIKSFVLESANIVTVKRNPASEFKKLDLNLGNGNYHLSLFDNQEKNILTNSKSIANNVVDFQLNHRPFGNGIYFLQITNDNFEHIFTKKIILK